MGANVDTGRVIDEFEQVLHTGEDMSRCHEAIVILRRWQWDEDLSDSCRVRAGMLVRQFGRRYSFRQPELARATESPAASPEN